MRVLVIFISILALSHASEGNTKRGIDHGHHNAISQGIQLTRDDISAGAAPAFNNQISFAQGPSHSDMGSVADSALRDVVRDVSLTQSNDGVAFNADSQADSGLQNEPERREPTQEYGTPLLPTSSELQAPSESQESLNNYAEQSSAEGSSSSGWSSQGPSVAEGAVIGRPYLISIHRETVRRYGVPVAKPYPVKVAKDVQVPIERRVPVKVDRPYVVRINVPQPYAVDRPYQVPVDRPYSVPVPQPVSVPVPQPVAVHVPQPIPVPVAQPTPVHVRVPVPQPVAFPVPQPVSVPVPVAAPSPVAVSAPLALHTPTAISAPVALSAPVPFTVSAAAPEATIADLRTAPATFAQTAPLALSQSGSLAFSTPALGAFPAFTLSQPTVMRALSAPAGAYGQSTFFPQPHLLQAFNSPQFSQASFSSVSAPSVAYGPPSITHGPAEPHLTPPPPPNGYQVWSPGNQAKRSVYKS